MTRLPHFRPLPLLLAGLLALAPLHRAQAEPAPQTIGGEPVVQMVAGVIHSCARVESGLVYCWGQNYEGQIGDGTRQDRQRPVQVLGLTEVIDITAGSGHNCALRRNGRVFCWGGNSSGQLGDRTRTRSSVPVRVVGLTRVTGIAAGSGHSCALRDTGRVFCWGRNDYGQLGDGTTTTYTLIPVRAEGPWSSRAVQIAAGDLHTCLLRQSGRVSCWGRNLDGQLGDGTTANRAVPMLVHSLSRVTRITTGAFHSCALRLTGRVFCWGGNGRGQLGDGTTTRRNTPVRVAGLTRVTQVAAGDQHNCALRESGRAFCWGNNRDSQLGFAHPDFQPRASKRVTGLTGIAYVAAGRSHSCAIQTDGQAWCWGSNNWGQLGDNTRLSRQTPVRVVD